LKSQLDFVRRAVPLLGDDDLGDALLFDVLLPLVFRHVHLLAVDEDDHVGVLLDGPGFAEVGQLRPRFAPAFLGRSTELGDADDGDLELFGQLFERAGDEGHLLVAVLESGPRPHELDVVDEDDVQALFHLQAAGLGLHLHQGQGGRFKLAFADVARADAPDVEEGVRAEHPGHDRLFRHFH
jgi:hypothetical protein